MTTEIYDKLKEPFPADDIEWRVQQAGARNNKPWAKVLAYVTNRAIMERLDEAVGPQNWRNEFKEAPGGGVICRLYIRVGGEWIAKEDGADKTNIEATKGGLSGAMKRAAVQWGIGRYLYNLEEDWANIHDKGENYQGGKQGKYPAFHWSPPQLPGWALPGGTGKPGKVNSRPRPAQAAQQQLKQQSPAQGQQPAPQGLYHATPIIQKCRTVEQLQSEWTKHGAAWLASADKDKISKLWLGKKAEIEAERADPVTAAQRRCIMAHYKGWDRERKLKDLGNFFQTEIESVNNLTKDMASEFIDAINKEAA